VEISVSIVTELIKGRAGKELKIDDLTLNPEPLNVELE
jgi:hypothetical protein